MNLPVFRAGVALLFVECAWSLTVNINASVGSAAPAIPVAESWASLTFWDYSSFLQQVPHNTTAVYPFLQRMELFTATGGCCEYLEYLADCHRVSVILEFQEMLA
jgi:hypothetical protein